MTPTERKARARLAVNLAFPEARKRTHRINNLDAECSAEDERDCETMPTAEEIAEMRQEIQAGWNETTRESRLVIGNPEVELQEHLRGDTRKGSNRTTN